LNVTLFLFALVTLTLLGSSAFAVSFINRENSIKTIKDIANKANKDPNNFKVILLTYPNIVDSKSASQRFPLTGTIDQVAEYAKNKANGHRSYNIWV